MPYTIIWHKLKMHTVVVVTILVTCLPPAMADDTDIFLGSSAPSASGTNPNVLFILDNSGSMQSDARDSDGVSTGQTRLEAMKSAFAEIMSTVSGINVGLMRFNGPGGSIEYPITNVNLSLASTDFQSVPDMLISEDDANELAANGAVTLDDTSLRIGHTTQLNTTQITGYIQHQEDDREESTSGPEIDGTYFNMNTYQINGLRYFDLNIPTGASIANAWLEFTSPTSGYTGDISIEISAQSADNPARFTGNDSDLDTRYQNERSSNTVVWGISNSQNWDMGQVYRSPNLRDVVQEIVDRADWDANDAMVFLVKGLSGNGQRAGTLYRNDSSSTQGSTGSNTKLVVEYSTSSSTTQTVTGLRFQQVNIPQGATVTAARINFFASIAHSTVDGLKLRIRAENTDNAAPFTATPFSLSARAKTASEVIWEPDSDWPLGESLTGPDVTSLVQQVVNRTDWCGNNALALYLEPTADSPVGWRDAYAFDDALEQHAELVVSFSGGESGCINQIWSQRVNSAEDDAEEPPGRRSRADNRSTDLDIESSIVSGIRFENIPAVQGGTILEAYLDVTASGNNSGNMSFTIRGHDDDNAPAFVNARRNITKRSQTSASVTWTPPDFVNAQVYRSPNLASIVQEIVDRSNWSVGNSLALILTASSSSTDRDISTFEAGPGVAPKLILKLANGATQSSPLTVASHLNDLVQNMDARTWTPIVDSLYEAALYFQGKDVYYGASRELFAQSDGFTSRQYKRVSVPGSYTGGTVVRDARCTDENLDSSYCASEVISSTSSAPKYISPITNECQNNHIVLLTDGEANNNHSIDKIRSLTSTPSCDSDASDADEKCGRTLVEWMANNDMATAFPNSRSTITTHTIAFNLSNNGAVDFLQDLATLGGGTFNTANTSAELSNAFDAILRNVISRNSTFTSPGATVNQFNQLTNREEIYFSVFKPEIRPLWSGNLKRYKLRGDPAVIVDVNDVRSTRTSAVPAHPAPNLSLRATYWIRATRKSPHPC
ncbi:MAG: VWA domain-containing protein [Gammaproteobacteria bacterium]